MKSTIILGALAVLAATVLWPVVSTQAQGQHGCKSLQAIGHAALPSVTPLNLPPMPSGDPGDEWGGPLYALLGGESLVGVLSGNDGRWPLHPHVGQGRDGSYTLGFNCTPPDSNTPYFRCQNTLTYEVHNAVWPISSVDPSGAAGFGHYNGNTAKIARGTGRFQYASGNLNVSGPFVFGTDGPPYGRFSANVSGDVCGVQ